ncbi:MAG: hypothetical protein J6Y57_08895 [Lachnospiraceae bacterium]|nr:hypothetical protein [Lachnospiraceae bacterium]
MKTKEKNVKKIPLLLGLILLIMAASFGFRCLVNHKVNTQLGEAYLDPETGVPYLTEMDSYYHLRMTKDIAAYGHAGDTVKDGELWDSLSFAPEGRSAEGYRPLMAYIAIFVQKFLSLFTVISLEQVAYWQGAFLSALVVIPVFILAYRLKGVIAAVVSSLLAAINYGYFIHTVPGFYDTDTVISWTSCFLFCFGCLLVDSFGKEKAGEKPAALWRRRIIYALLFILSFIALLQSWYIYYLFAGLFAAALFVYMLLKHLNRGEEKAADSVRSLLPELVFFGALCVLVIATNPDLFRSAFDNIKGVFSSGDDLFPNALISVSEMRKPSLIAGGLTGLFQMRVLSGSDIGIINAVGGMIPCLAALSMCVLMIVKTFKKEIRFDHILLILWFVITAVLAVRSWRFIMLFAVPVAILAGALTGTVCSLMREKKMMDHQIFAAMIILLMIFPAVYGAYRSSGDSLPSVNRDLHDSLSYIRDNTSADTIVAGWWDYGYFFEEKSQRRTLFDGGSQTGQRVFWMGRALATDSEDLSANIIRMLSGSGDRATEKMLETFGENRETLALMDELLRTDRAEAARRLQAEGLGSDEAATLADLLFPSSSVPAMLLLTSDMPRITAWFAKFGYYGEEAEKPYRLLMDRTPYTEQEGKTGWQINVDGEDVRFFLENQNGSFRAYTSLHDKSDETQPLPVERLILIEDERATVQKMEVPQTDGTGYTVVLFRSGGQAAVSLMSSDLMESVFGRLFYLGGAELTRFVPETDAPGSAAVFRVAGEQ